MAVSQELVWLINQIRNTPSARDRLRLLARGWRTLKELSTADRIAIARELGFDGAGELVEQLARRGGASPSLLLQALESLESADPDRIKRLVRGLTDADQRVGSAERLMDAAAGWLEGEIAGAERAGPGELLEGDLEDVQQAMMEAHPPPPPPPPPPEVVDVGTTLDESRERESEVEVVQVDDTETADETEEEATVDEGEKPERPPVPEERERFTTAVAGESANLPGERMVAPSMPDLESVAATLAAASSLTSRLRMLAGVVDDLEGAGLRQLNAVVAVFPSGWSRRRAIETLLRSGLPHTIGDALELISKLERPSERMWALTTLAASRELDDDDRQELIAAAGSPSIQRRLRMRLSS